MFRTWDEIKKSQHASGLACRRKSKRKYGNTNLLDRLSDDLLGLAIRIHVRRVPGRHTLLPCSFEQREGLVTEDRISLRFIDHPIRRPTSSSLMTHDAHLSLPNDIAPRMGTETRRPLLPRRRYSTFWS
jgi:hypothetical protein